MERLRYPVAAVAFAGFVLALAVHVAALRGIDASATWPAVRGLHVGIFVVFIPFVFASRRVLGRKPAFGRLRALLPAWVMVVGGAIFAYAILNFLWSVNELKDGAPVLRDGHYVVQNHGRFIRDSSLAEYQAGKVTEIRMFSGHWIVFYFMPFAFFAFARSMAPLGKPAPDARRSPLR